MQKSGKIKEYPKFDHPNIVESDGKIKFVDSNGKTVQLKVPLLTIVPIPYISKDSIDLDKYYKENFGESNPPKNMEDIKGVEVDVPALNIVPIPPIPIKEDEEPDHKVEDWDFYYKGKKIGSSKIDRDLKTGIGKTVSFKDENDNDVEYDDDSRYAQCVWCGDHLPKNEMRKEKKMGWLCYRCARGLESREGKLDYDDDIEECTCAGAVASVPQNIFAKPIKRKQATKESKDLQFAKEAANMLDEYCFSLNGKHINYDARDGFNVFVEGVITTVSNKEDFFTLLEMIDNNEDISDYLLEGLSIEDFKFLKEDIDSTQDPNEQPLPADDDANAPEQPDRTADTGDTAYQDKKNKLQQMADTGVSNITVKQVDTQGNETTNDDYEIQGIEDLDDTGKPSNAIIKNKNTGEMKTVDPHIIDIKS